MDARLLVIADDLTGALDTGVQFANAGVRTIVVPYARLAEALRRSETPVLVVDTQSRHLPPRRAGSRVAACVRAARARGIGRFYKKTDSTLRGNVGAELAALLSASRAQELFFVPALPQAGRVTRSGVQFVDGVPLHETGFARDALDPVHGGSIAAIIASQCGMAVVTVGRGEDPGPALERAGRPLIVVFDAETDRDLDAIADRLASRAAPCLGAGCSGFAAFLPRLHGLKTGPAAALVLRPPLLVVSGSLNERSLEQLRAAELAGTPSHEIDAAAISRPGSRQAAAGTIAEDLRERGVAIVRSPAVRAVRPGTSRALLRAMGRVVGMIVAETDVPTIALFGGDTAFAIVEALGICAFEPLGEIDHGVVAARTTGSRARGALALVTKAGGFGPADVIDRIRGALTREA
jgi:uncharacterized protein YgbK (DUF1537 family)